MRGNREWDAGAAQREIDARARNRICGIVSGQIGQPITHGITAVAVLEIHHYAVGARLEGDVRNRFCSQSSLDRVNYLCRGVPKIDIEIDPLAMLAWLPGTSAQ